MFRVLFGFSPSGQGQRNNNLKPNSTFLEKPWGGLEGVWRGQVGLMNLTGLCCYLEALGAADPLARRRGLQALTKSVSEAPLHVRVQFIARHSFNLIIERMQDPVEKCRDISLGLITRFVRECSVDDLEHKGRQIISAAIARFGSRPFQEPVEELRLRYLPCDWIVSRSIFYISK